MARLDQTVGACAYDDIFAGTSPEAHTATVKLAASDKPMARGTVLAGTPGGNLAPLSKAAADGEAVYILAETLDSAAEGDVAVAYKTGLFARNRLRCAEGYELAASDVEALRQAGIITADIIEPAE